MIKKRTGVPIEISMLEMLDTAEETCEFTVEDILRKIGEMQGQAVDGEVIYTQNYRTRYIVTGNEGRKIEYAPEGSFTIDTQYRRILVWFDEEGIAWQSTFQIIPERPMYYNTFRMYIGRFFPSDGKMVDLWAVFLNSNAETVELAKKYAPSGVTYIDDLMSKGLREGTFSEEDKMNAYRNLLLYPSLEHLAKGGIAFAKDMLRGEILMNGDIGRLSRLVKPEGKTIQEAMKPSEAVWKTYANEHSLAVWDNIRKMERQGRLPSECIPEFYMYQLSGSELKKFDSILLWAYKDKRLFTCRSLLQYLNRLDTEEAIEPSEAVTLLYEYLCGCRSIQVKPRLKNSSLRKEIDLLNRRIRQDQNRKYGSEMQDVIAASQEQASINNYSNSRFTIRALKDYAELEEEFNGQHIPLKIYAVGISKKRVWAYTMRSISEPDKPLVTVFIPYAGDYIISMFNSNGEPVTETDHLEFLNEWMVLVKDKIARGEGIPLPFY